MTPPGGDVSGASHLRTFPGALHHLRRNFRVPIVYYHVDSFEYINSTLLGGAVGS